MALLNILDSGKLSDGKERKKTFISYASDADQTIVSEVTKNFTENDSVITYTADPSLPFTDELAGELTEMDDMLFISSPSLYSDSPARTILRDIPFMIGRGILPYSVQQKDHKWLNIMDEVFLTLYHAKGEKEHTELDLRKIISETIRVVTREYEGEIPEEMVEPLYSARLSLCKGIMDEEPCIVTRTVYGTAVINSGNQKRLSGHREEALELLRKAWLLFEDITEKTPTWDSLIFGAKAASITARIHMEDGDERKAKRWYRRVAKNAGILRSDKKEKDNPEMAELDSIYIDALIHLASYAEKDGEVKAALDYLFDADLAIKEHPDLVPHEVIHAIGDHIDELAGHVLSGMNV